MWPYITYNLGVWFDISYVITMNTCIVCVAKLQGYVDCPTRIDSELVNMPSLWLGTDYADCLV